MAIKQRGASWQVDVTLSGIRHRKNFTTAKQARAWELKAVAADMEGLPIPSADAVQEPEETPAKQKTPSPPVKKTTPEQYTLRSIARAAHARTWAGTSSDKKQHDYIRLLEEFFGADKDIREIDSIAIDSYLQDCILRRRNSNATLNKKLSSIKVILKYAKTRGFIDRLPDAQRKRESSSRIRWLTDEEEKGLLALFKLWGKDDHADAVTVLLDTGFRPGELYTVTGNDFNEANGTLTIWATKTDQPRTVYLTTRVKQILARRKQALSSGNEKLFPYDNQWMRNAWERARDHLGFLNDPHFVPYICRHTCASRLVQRGVSLLVVKEFLGHKHIIMTQRYAHLAPHNLKEAAEVLDKAS